MLIEKTIIICNSNLNFSGASSQNIFVPKNKCFRSGFR